MEILVQNSNRIERSEYSIGNFYFVYKIQFNFYRRRPQLYRFQLEARTTTTKKTMHVFAMCECFFLHYI